MSGNTISILEGNTFVVSDRRGDVDASPTEPQGLFDSDTRYLSKWVLTVNGIRPTTLSTDDVEYYLAQFFLAPTSGTTYVDADLSVIRARSVHHGFHEDIRILNHGAKAVDVDVKIEAAADFADLFEVKDALKKKGELYHRIEGNELVLGYRRGKFMRETHIRAEGAQISENAVAFRAHIEPHEEWKASIDVHGAVLADGKPFGGISFRDRPQTHISVEEAIEAAPKIFTDWLPLVETYQRSLVDAAALRFFPLLTPDAALPAAGLPWFMAAFGRDSIYTSLQILPFNPDLAKTTLRYLAMRQGKHVDDFRDEEPGKILHETRSGEMTAFLERPHSPYFGACDSTALFLILLDEYELWTGDSDLVKLLEFEARAALGWIDDYGDRDGDGYVEYSRRNTETGLENQCWKDSWNSILFADGTLSELPRATCEIQGYVYDAKVRCARLARTFWGDEALATRLERDAADLKRRFNEDYWMEDRKCFGLAIDGSGRLVDSITSNIGHLLWSGIVDDAKVEHVVGHLMGDELFSGWGVRTMASSEGGYNPIGYHVGTVWPFDNSIIALGLNRYGYRDESSRIASGILQAANFFNHRLPEAFGGYPRQETRFPVEYPTACSPQAWSTGAPFLFLRTMLGLEPRGNRLLVDANLPPEIEWLELRDLPGRWGTTDAAGRRSTRPSGRVKAAPARKSG
ncbi:MAG TPA: glycogen debranching N-terminal domain-containing protein [Polyangiaceae bacterium]|nr:glycogen debranching N-terminal domain-containing protein [Polyangiaceae bacterium]